METEPTKQSIPAWKTGYGYQDTDFGQLLHGFSVYERESFLQMGRVIDYPISSLIVREGYPSNHFYVILFGKVAIWSHDLKVKYQVLTKGSVFGEVSFFGPSRVATAEAETYTELLQFERDKVLDWFRRREERLFKLFVFNLTRIIISKLIGANERIRELELLLREGR
ncbi:MAG: cyclic nucleotide-binding domain-containing protein [bacterium]|nr:cyclic nucleotide-binding domain-containing protein [bacterium]